MRQLVNTLQHAAVTCKGEIIDVSDLPDYVFGDNGVVQDEHQDEKAKIQSALDMFKGNRTMAAKHLGISRVTLWKIIKDHKIQV